MSTILKDLPPQTQQANRRSRSNSSTTDLLEASQIFFELAISITNILNKQSIETSNIGHVSYDEFELDLNKMKVDQRYIVNYDSSIYGAIKNKKGELELYELVPDEH